jgi:hypothetical protein
MVPPKIITNYVGILLEGLKFIQEISSAGEVWFKYIIK